jgi:hypothetical protein
MKQENQTGVGKACSRSSVVLPIAAVPLVE